METNSFKTLLNDIECYQGDCWNHPLKHSIRPKDLPAIVEALNKNACITSVDFSGNGYLLETGEELNALEHVTELDLSQCGITNTKLNALLKNSKLETLYLSDNPFIDEDSIAALKASGLKKVNLVETSISSNSREKISKQLDKNAGIVREPQEINWIENPNPFGFMSLLGPHTETTKVSTFSTTQSFWELPTSKFPPKSPDILPGSPLIECR